MTFHRSRGVKEIMFQRVYKHSAEPVTGCSTNVLNRGTKRTSVEIECWKQNWEQLKGRIHRAGWMPGYQEWRRRRNLEWHTTPELHFFKCPMLPNIKMKDGTNTTEEQMHHWKFGSALKILVPSIFILFYFNLSNSCWEDHWVPYVLHLISSSVKSSW